VSPRNGRRGGLIHRLRAALAAACGLVQRRWRRLRRRDVVVLTVDSARRRAAERALTMGLRHLRATLAERVPEGVVVLAQDTVAGAFARTDRWRRPDGRELVLIRIALRADDRPLGPDELIAALADELVPSVGDGTPPWSPLGTVGVEPDVSWPPDPLAAADRSVHRGPA
jgi:hypothetical protein